jgi:hypothetical protein
MSPDKKSYGSAELDKIIQDRRESLKRIRADLHKIGSIQDKLQAEQEEQRKAREREQKTPSTPPPARSSGS